MSITFYDNKGLSLYLRFNDASSTGTPVANNPVGLKEREYIGTASGLPAATYDALICVGSAFGQNADDEIRAVVHNIIWDGAAETGVHTIHYGFKQFIAPSQRRINKPAGVAFQLQISNRADGTHKATSPIRVRVGTVGLLAVSLDMQSLFGDEYVDAVGTPTVDASGYITAEASGPRDTQAIVILGGSAVADATYTVTVPVTMDSGESVDVDFDVEVFED